ncbi:MAG: c-type cytochrome [Verrucomicrobiae bacterium]|nr:c-type cytochrome [Verrucomicrobiae bacterium]
MNLTWMYSRACLALVCVTFGQIATAPGAEWGVAQVPSTSELSAGAADESGERFAWYRSYVHVPSEWQGSRLLLIAGAISGVDEAFFNGRKIGANGAMPPLYSAPASSIRRPYVIEPDWIRFGEDNLVAWRVFSPEGASAARITLGPVHLTRKDDAIDLSGNWQFRRGDSPEWKDWESSGPNPAEVQRFHESAGADFASARGVVPADTEHREKMIAAVYKKFEGNPNPYARSDDKGEPLDPDASKATFVLSDGLAVDTVLSEPIVRQPLYVDFDERGRMWVVQYIQYPNPAGLEVLTWDDHLRKVFDQVPPPPPYDRPEKAKFKGHDRITIHEDRDGDGTYDSHKVFIDGLSLATSVAQGDGGVWVMQPPYLLFYPDVDNDDVPDGDPIVHLSGFGLEDTHSVANSLKWGPDGWLYGGVGSTVTARVRVHLSGSDRRHSFFGQNIWRYHPEMHVFELFAEGGWNTFGVDFDDMGRVYSGTNGNLQAVHFVQGGYYQKSFGKHGPHTNPYTFGHFGGMPIQGEAIRMVHQWIYYSSGAIPPLEGLLVGGNALGSKLHALQMNVRGSTFETNERPNPLRTEHKWFRPVHATAGPDGAIYISDFYDARITHVDPRDNWDRDRGRIYRLRAVDASASLAPDLSQLSSWELVAKLESRNQWTRRTSQRLLAERKDPAVVPLLAGKLKGSTGTAALEMLWAIHGTGGLSDAVTVEAMGHANEHVRAWAVRLAGDSGATLFPEVFDKICSLAKDDKSPVVVSQLASTAARLPSPQALSVVELLSQRGDFVSDPFIPQQLWWALEVQMTRDPLRCVALFENAGFWSNVIVETTLAERVGRRLMADRTAENLTLCGKLLEQAADPDIAKALIRGMTQAIEGTSLTEVPEALDAAIGELWNRYPDDEGVIQFGMRLGSAKALAMARTIIRDVGAAASRRVQFVGMLSEMVDPPLIDVLLNVLKDSNEGESVKMAALNGLRRYTGAEIPEVILTEYSGMPLEMQKTSQAILASRLEWSIQLLQAVDEGKLRRESIAFDTLLAIQARGDESSAALIAKHWGTLRQPPEAKAKRMQQVRAVLGSGKGDITNGSKLFAASCGACHRLGDVGRYIAPDLTGYERGNLEFLLPAIVDPNLGVREEFELVSVTLRAAEGVEPTILSGFVSEATKQSITVKDLVGNETTVSRQDIAGQLRSPVSVMPEGLLDALTDQEILDLFAFLQKK